MITENNRTKKIKKMSTKEKEKKENRKQKTSKTNNKKTTKKKTEQDRIAQITKELEEEIGRKIEEHIYKEVAKSAFLNEIKKILQEANDAYYNTGNSTMSDEEFDELLDIIRENSPDDPFLNEIGAPIRDEVIKEPLPYWMGSMDKVKPNTKELESWLSKNKSPYVISEKLDGVSALLSFNFEKPNTIMLYTRGNGKIGQNISYLIPQLHLNNDAILKKVKTTKISIRGELIMKKTTFEEKYSMNYPKCRSLVSGNVNAKKPDPNIIKDMDFIGYEVILDENNSKSASIISIEKQFKLIKQLNLKCVNYKIVKETPSSEVLTKHLLDMKTKSDYEIDGIIISNNKENIKNTSGNPKYAVAFKTKLDEQMETTSVVDVEWNPSKHGTLIPRIKFEPIVIGGDKLSRGLTLEGLSISYFLRSAKMPMYDTLMQMGRWFGYRTGFEDLCRLYTTDNVIRWFFHISVATEELRNTFRIMAAQGSTPAEFGLKVRTNPNLIITSKTKMRHSKIEQTSFSQEVTEVVTFMNNDEVIKSNYEATNKLLIEAGKPSEAGSVKCSIHQWKNSYKWKNVNS